MRKKDLMETNRVILIFLIFLTIGSADAISYQQDHLVLKGDYFGLIRPGIRPEIFAPGVISEAGYRLHGFPAFSPNGNQVYWSVIPPKIMYMIKNNNIWSKPGPAPFSNGNMQAPYFSFDGKRLFFQAVKKGGFGGLDIWYVEKTETGWSEPKNTGRPVNSPKLESQPTLTKNGTIYFAGSMENTGFNRGIYYSRYINGTFSEPVPLNYPVNSKYIDAYPFIARDESYLLFCSSRPDMEEKDMKLFLSFRKGENTWDEPVNLNKILGIESPAKYPYVSPDENFLFFLNKGNIYWVDIKIIEQLRIRSN